VQFWSLVLVPSSGHHKDIIIRHYFVRYDIGQWIYDHNVQIEACLTHRLWQYNFNSVKHNCILLYSSRWSFYWEWWFHHGIISSEWHLVQSENIFKFYIYTSRSIKDFKIPSASWYTWMMRYRAMIKIVIVIFKSNFSPAFLCTFKHLKMY
jgi:hypothetical protein